MQSESNMAPSLYIPVINANVTQEYIAKCFHEQNIGKVERVDFVINKAKLRREAFVHFSEWYSSDATNQLKAQLEITLATGQNCRFIHNGTNYWPLLLNKNPLDKNNPDRKSNSVYELEERISNIEKSMEQLSFMTKLHDANIRYILRKNTSEETNSVTPQIKRFKTEAGTSVSSKRAAIREQAAAADGRLVTFEHPSYY